MKKIFLIIFSVITSISAMQKEDLVKNYEARATRDWLPTTIAFMNDPQNVEAKESKMLRRYILMVNETIILYQYRYSMPEEKAIERACKETPADSHDWNFIERGSRCGSDGLASCRQEWEEMFNPLEALLKEKFAQLCEQRVTQEWKQSTKNYMLQFPDEQESGIARRYINGVISAATENLQKIMSQEQAIDLARKVVPRDYQSYRWITTGEATGIEWAMENAHSVWKQDLAQLEEAIQRKINLIKN